MRNTIGLRITLILIILMTGLVGSVPLSQAQNNQLIWSQVAGVPNDVFLEEVAMLNSSSAWAVGWQGDTGVVYRLELRDGRWQVALDGRFAQRLYALALTAPDTVWAVGDAGLILRRDAQGWQSLPSPVADARLRTIQMLGNGSDGLIGGDRSAGPEGREPVLLRFQGGLWERDNGIPFRGDSYIADLHSSPAGTWAVGTSIWRYVGPNWVEEAAPELCGGAGCYFYLLGVHAVGFDRAVAIGGWGGICTACTSNLYLIENSNNAWRTIFSSQRPPNFPPTQNWESSFLTDVAFSNALEGVAVGNWSSSSARRPLVLRYRNGTWTTEYARGFTSPDYSLNGMAMANPDQILAVGGGGMILSYGYGVQTPDPLARVSDPGDPQVRYFPETGHTLRGEFRTYWERYGGLAQFGYPLSEEFVEGGYRVQYFERARFEHHPENQPPYNVLLGLLGTILTNTRSYEEPFQPLPAPGQPGTRYFAETGHGIAPEFVGYWQRRGGLAIYGYPISEAFYEVNPADGQSYLVQYFERNRFEYHPELPQPYRVSLGLLGVELMRLRGWID